MCLFAPSGETSRERDFFKGGGVEKGNRLSAFKSIVRKKNTFVERKRRLRKIDQGESKNEEMDFLAFPPGELNGLSKI